MRGSREYFLWVAFVDAGKHINLDLAIYRLHGPIKNLLLLLLLVGATELLARQARALTLLRVQSCTLLRSSCCHTIFRVHSLNLRLPVSKIRCQRRDLLIKIVITHTIIIIFNPKFISSLLITFYQLIKILAILAHLLQVLRIPLGKLIVGCKANI